MLGGYAFAPRALGQAASGDGCPAPGAVEDWSQSGTTQRTVTQLSDIVLYERRVYYWFSYGTGISEHLPPKDTPEEQVAACSLFDFFRLVQFHGGKNPYLSWYDPDSMPILVMSPVFKLRGGPDFAFGARCEMRSTCSP